MKLTTNDSFRQNLIKYIKDNKTDLVLKLYNTNDVTQPTDDEPVPDSGDLSHSIAIPDAQMFYAVKKSLVSSQPANSLELDFDGVVYYVATTAAVEDPLFNSIYITTMIHTDGSTTYDYDKVALFVTGDLGSGGSVEYMLSIGKNNRGSIPVNTDRQFNFLINLGESE